MRTCLTGLLAILAVSGCSDPTSNPVPSGQTLNLKAVGLWKTSNPLDAPDGALETADNAVIRRRNVVESRRGQAADANVPGGANVNSLVAFEGGVVAHTTDNSVAKRDDDTTMTAYSGTYLPPTGERTRFVEGGGGLYFTTNAGPYRLDSLTSTPTPAGVPPGLEGSGMTVGSSGWLANNLTTGYRLVWGRRDEDGAVLLGAPSGRITVTNTAGAGRDVELSTPIPDGILLDVHFLQVYRTVREVTSPADPGEDFAQVAEVFPTADDIAAGTITVTDISSFANGEAAYFSQNTGGGVLDSKNQPPLLTDAVMFKGYMFGVVQAYQQSLSLTLLAVGGGTALSSGMGLRFYDGITTEDYTAGVAESFPNVFQVSSGGTAAQNIEDTARSLVRAINSRSGGLLYATYASSDGDLPGKIIITSRVVGGPRIQAEAIVNAAPWTPRMRLRREPTSAVQRSAGVVTVTYGLFPHGVTVGDTIELVDYLDPADEALFPRGIKTVTQTLSLFEFRYAEAGANASAADGLIFTSTTEPVYFTQEATGGSWAHSAFEEPDAWPPRFQWNIGGANAVLYRIIGQGEALLFWTSAGLYRLTGTDETDFALRPVDDTVRLAGKNTVVALGNKAYALTDQGVVAVSDLGVEKVSEEIDAALLPFYSGSASAREATEAAGFGIASESENEYILFLPSESGDVGDPATQAYVYNAQTGAWVRWTFLFPAASGETGFVNAGLVPPEGRLYLASGDRLSRERKDRNLADYEEPDGSGVPVDIAYQVQTAKNPGVSKAWVEATFLLEPQQPASVGLYFSTEVDTTEEGGTVPTRNNLSVRTYIPRNKARSTRLTAGITHSTAGERLSLLGLSVIYNTASQRAGR